MGPVVSARPRRAIFRCRRRACGKVWAYDYPLGGARNRARLEAGSRRCIGLGEDLDRGCPACGDRHPRLAVVAGCRSDHACDERCLSATGATCECSCGGANHGRAHLMEAA